MGLSPGITANPNDYALFRGQLHFNMQLDTVEAARLTGSVTGGNYTTLVTTSGQATTTVTGAGSALTIQMTSATLFGGVATVAASAAVTAGGSGYVVGDVIRDNGTSTPNGGASGRARFVVAAVNAGAVTQLQTLPNAFRAGQYQGFKDAGIVTAMFFDVNDKITSIDNFRNSVVTQTGILPIESEMKMRFIVHDITQDVRMLWFNAEMADPYTQAAQSAATAAFTLRSGARIYRIPIGSTPSVPDVGLSALNVSSVSFSGAGVTASDFSVLDPILGLVQCKANPTTASNVVVTVTYTAAPLPAIAGSLVGQSGTEIRPLKKARMACQLDALLVNAAFNDQPFIIRCARAFVESDSDYSIISTDDKPSGLPFVCTLEADSTFAQVLPAPSGITSAGVGSIAIVA